jgi:iodotyrosine deiodinase
MPQQEIINGHPFISYTKEAYEHGEMLQRGTEFYRWMDTRRTVRDFSNKPVAKAVIENIIMTASTAPSGAHKQPWTFCVVSNPDLKKQIRIAAEREEYESYNGRMTEEWMNDLAPLHLIIVFKRSYEFESNNKKHQNYYVTESCGIACGFLLAAIHHAGLAALTHTPSPMNFLARLLNRPENEKPFLLIPVGYTADVCLVPDIQRKPLDEIYEIYE